MNRKSVVSVCLPTFNGQKYIEEALHSIISQTYRPLELIVSDDNSSDNTLQIIHEITSSWSIPIKILKHQPSGIGANWNNCVKHAGGKYIKFLFQDDILYPTCISEMVTLAEKDDEVGIVFSHRDIIGDLDSNQTWLKKFGNLLGAWENVSEIQSGRDLLKQNNILDTPNNKIGEPSVVLIRSACFKDIGYFAEDLKQTLDYEYWYRLLTKYKVGLLEKPLAAFRLHEEQATQINKATSVNREMLLCYTSLCKNVSSNFNFKNKIKVRVRILQYFTKWGFLNILLNND